MRALAIVLLLMLAAPPAAAAQVVLREVLRAPEGTFVDFDGARGLALSVDGTRGLVVSSTSPTVAIELPQPVRGGLLVEGGAFFFVELSAFERQTYFLWTAQRGLESFTSPSAHAAGRWFAFVQNVSVAGPPPSVEPQVTLRDVTTGMEVFASTVMPGLRPWISDLLIAPDGDVVWTEGVGSQNVYWRDDDVVRGGGQGTAIDVDGTNVCGGSFRVGISRVWLSTPSGTEQICGRTSSGCGRCALNAGWTAYTAVPGQRGGTPLPSAGPLQIFRRSPEGVHEQLSSFPGESAVIDVSPQGDVVGVYAGELYLFRSGAEPVGLEPMPAGRVVYRDAWYLLAEAVYEIEIAPTATDGGVPDAQVGDAGDEQDAAAPDDGGPGQDAGEFEDAGAADASSASDGGRRPHRPWPWWEHCAALPGLPTGSGGSGGLLFLCLSALVLRHRRRAISRDVLASRRATAE